MSDRSKIEWTDATWNPVRARNRRTGRVGWHCEHATTGCEHCYSEALNRRLGTGLPFKPGHRRDVDLFLDEETLVQPLRWRRPRMVFVCSMTDLFADFVADEWIDRVFAVMALCPQHTFQVLTKRAARMCAYAQAMDKIVSAQGIDNPWSGAWPLPNVWLGVSAERQREADERVPLLRRTPAAVRFVSLEPLLGPIDMRGGAGLDWAIVGGESGRGARAMHPDWARSLRDQCAAAGVAFFFKQWGEWAWGPDDLNYGDALSWAKDRWLYLPRFEAHSCGHTAFRVGKSGAGRILDGALHDAMPGAAT